MKESLEQLLSQTLYCLFKHIAQFNLDLAFLGINIRHG